MEIISDRAYFATWGGLEVYDLSTNNFVQKLTTIDGLSKNEIRTIDYFNNDQLLLGTFGGGIDRYNFYELITKTFLLNNLAALTARKAVKSANQQKTRSL